MRFILLFSIIILLFLSIQAQRGGGRSTKTRTKTRTKTTTKTRSKTSNSTNTDLEEQEQIELTWFAYFQNWVIVVFGIWGCIASCLETPRNQKIKKAMDQFAKKSLQTNLEESQIVNAKQWFMKQLWKIRYSTKAGQSGVVDITSKNIENRSKYSYNIQMFMNDGVGSSKATGVLIHQGSQLAIKFEKTYKDRVRAGQRDGYDLLYYEGVQEGQVFKGKWAYQGYQNNNDYAGEWEMYYLPDKQHIE